MCSFCATSEFTLSFKFYIINSFCVLDSEIDLISCESEAMSLEQTVQAAAEALARQVKAESCEPFQNTSQITEPNRGQSEVSLKARLDAEHGVK